MIQFPHEEEILVMVTGADEASRARTGRGDKAASAVPGSWALIGFTWQALPPRSSGKGRPGRKPELLFPSVFPPLPKTAP